MESNLTAPLQWLQLIAIVIGAIIAVGAAVVYIVSQVRKADIKIISANNKNLTDRVKILEDENTAKTTTISSLEAKVGLMEIALKKKDEIIDHLRTIQITNSPEMITYMAEMRTFETQVHTYMINSTKNDEEIKGLIKSQPNKV